MSAGQLIEAGAVLAVDLGLVLLLIFVACALIGMARSAVQRRAEQRFWVAVWENRPKAEITMVGTVEQLPNGQYAIDDWGFLLRQPIPPFCRRPHGEQVFFGYTVPELQEVVARPAEFVRCQS